MSGFPGSGKSTLILQLAELFAKMKKKVHYTSGEESLAQIKMRAERIGVNSHNIVLLAETNFKNTMFEIVRNKPDVVIIDSIQTMEIEAKASSTTQIDVIKYLTKYAKVKGVPVFVIGHITKEGDIAGNETLQHLVDAVLQLHGDKSSAYRVLKAKKNRFGATDETIFFKHDHRGLVLEENVSGMFLMSREPELCGSVIVATMQGTQCVLAEIQSLVSPSMQFKINAFGLDAARVNLIISILEYHGMIEKKGEIYVSVSGGLRIDDPSVDLGVAASILSTYNHQVFDYNSFVFGEIGLSGEIKGVKSSDLRVKSGEKLGFSRVVLPAYNLPIVGELSFEGIKNIKQLETLF